VQQPQNELTLQWKEFITVCSYDKRMYEINFMVTPCINNIQHSNIQLMHTTLKNVELLKHFQISKTAPTCFGLQGKPSSGSHNQYLAKNYTLG
jgi:hypothetical protein